MSDLDHFRELAARPVVPLGEGCAAIAAHLGSDDAAARCAAGLDRLAEQVSAGADLEAVAHALFGADGLRGNRARYYDPRNSLLPEVIERRLGIPITLSVVVIEVAARVGATATPVGMPGHFLVGDGRVPTRWLDAFDGGRWLDATEARGRFHAIHGEEVVFDVRFLEPTPHTQVLGRVLTNLALIHGRLGDPNALVRVLELRSVVPGVGDAPRARVEWADALAAVGRTQEAIDVLDAVRDRVDPRRRDAIDGRVARLRATRN